MMVTRSRARIARITARYGFRTPFVTLYLFFERLHLASYGRCLKWRLITRGRKGDNIRIGRATYVSPGSEICVGSNVRIGDRVVVEIYVEPRAKLVIGSNVWLSHDCHICAFKCIVIGSGVLIGEFVSIRDSMHQYSSGHAISSQGNSIGEILIEEDVWIGRGCLILGRPEGVVLGRGSVIGANSVVATSVPAGEVWAGVPARFIKKRDAA
jgi:acetyltransferase-like isoleucine patch superfamily enzyme